MTSLRLEKRLPEKNQFRFYRLDLQPTLFGEWSVVREWGRIGRQGRVVVDTFKTEPEAQSVLLQKAAEKHRRGYALLIPSA
jgi:predicted DNA-binding WGR domain protein